MHLCRSFQHFKDLLKYTKNKTDQIEQLDATIELIGERFHDEMMSMVQKNSDLSSQIAESASLLQGKKWLNTKLVIIIMTPHGKFNKNVNKAFD